MDRLETSKKHTEFKETPSAHIIKNNERVSYVAIPPDGGWGWVVVGGAFCSYFISDGLLYSFGIFLKDIATAFECKESKVSLAGALNSCFFCISGPFSAAFINKYGFRTVSFCGCLLASISCLLTSFSSSMNLVIASHGVVGGIGFGMVYISAVIAVGFYFEHWRAIATGVAVCGAGLGEISLPPLFAMLLQKLGWRNTFRILSGMCLALTLASLSFKPIKLTRVLLETDLLQTKDTYPTKNSLGKLIDRNVSTITILPPVKNVLSEIISVTTYSVKTDSFDGKENLAGEESYSEQNIAISTRKGCCKKNTYYSPTIQKEDIFYSSSIVNLPDYKATLPKAKIINSKSRSNIAYQMSITKTFIEKPVSLTRCKRFWLYIQESIKTLLDFHLMENTKFVLFILNAILSSLGFYTPYMFIKDATIQEGISSKVAIWFVPVMGLTNTIGRISCGLLAVVPGVKVLLLACCLLFLAGVATILSTFSYQLWVQFLYCGLYGFCLASMSSLKTVILVKVFGLEKLTNAMGLLLLSQGISTLIGISITGYLKDFTHNYKCSFYFGGTCISLGTVFLIILYVQVKKAGIIV